MKTTSTLTLKKQLIAASAVVALGAGVATLPMSLMQRADAATNASITPLDPKVEQLVKAIYASDTPLVDSAGITDGLRTELEINGNGQKLLYGQKEIKPESIDVSLYYQKEAVMLVGVTTHKADTSHALYSANIQLEQQNGIWKITQIAPDRPYDFVTQFYSSLPRYDRVTNDIRVSQAFRDRIASGPINASPFLLTQSEHDSISFETESETKERASYILTVKQGTATYQIRAEAVRGIGGVWQLDSATRL